MKKLTSQEVGSLIQRLRENETNPRKGLTGDEKVYLAVLEIALPILEQQESEGTKSAYKCPNCGNDGWSANCDHCIPY